MQGGPATDLRTQVDLILTPIAYPLKQEDLGRVSQKLATGTEMPYSYLIVSFYFCKN